MKNTKSNKNNTRVAPYRNGEFFKVVGAGKIEIGNDPNSVCGNVEGFSIGVEWGAHGYAGGVMDKKEAKRLADFIYDKLFYIPPTQEYIKIKKVKKWKHHNYV